MCTQMKSAPLKKGNIKHQQGRRKTIHCVYIRLQVLLLFFFQKKKKTKFPLLGPFACAALLHPPPFWTWPQALFHSNSSSRMKLCGPGIVAGGVSASPCYTHGASCRLSKLFKRRALQRLLSLYTQYTVEYQFLAFHRAPLSFYCYYLFFPFYQRRQRLGEGKK